MECTIRSRSRWNGVRTPQSRSSRARRAGYDGVASSDSQLASQARWRSANSDGLTAVVRDPEIAEVAAQRPPGAAAERLIALANERGAPDNVTVVVAGLSASAVALAPTQAQAPPQAESPRPTPHRVTPLPIGEDEAPRRRAWPLLLGGLAVGFLAQGFAWQFRAPAVAFAFPGVVAMIPGAFAFRAVLGGLQLVNAGANAAPALVAETLALAASCFLMVAAIAVGIAAPLSLTKKGTTQG